MTVYLLSIIDHDDPTIGDFSQYHFIFANRDTAQKKINDWCNECNDQIKNVSYLSANWIIYHGTYFDYEVEEQIVRES